MSNKPKSIRNNKESEDQKKNKSGMYIAAIALLFLTVILVLVSFLFKSCSSAPKEVTSTGIVYDDNAIEGGWNNPEDSSIVEDLNKKVEAGMINISMNTAPVFETGTSEGYLMIVNENCNNYPQKVTISRNDTNSVIYESKAIPVGSKIEKTKLDVSLPAGEYECTATFHNLDPATGNSLGCACAIIYITVKS